MPLVQERGGELNNFLDVAIKDDLNPIVDAARRQHSPFSATSKRGRNKRGDSEKQKWSDGDSKSIRSAPARARSSAQRSFSKFQEVNLDAEEAVSVAAHTVIERGAAADDASYDSKDDLLFAPNRNFSINFLGGKNSVEVGESSAEGQSFEIKQADLTGETITNLEQEMAKINFELAEASAQVDWYKLQHRQLHLEFEDLQAFCKQLQAENLELRENRTNGRRKPNWFKAARRLNQPRSRVDYEDTAQAVHGNSSFHHEESSLSPSNDADDWDDDTLTTNFGGASRMGDDSTAQRKGPLFSGLLSKGSASVGSGKSNKHDTPRDITVNKQSATNLGGDPQPGLLDDSNESNESTKETHLIDSQHGREDVQESQNDCADEHRRKGLFGGRFSPKSGSQSVSMRRHTDASVNTSKTSKTMPNIGWNKKKHRASASGQLEKHRFVPPRRGSILGPDSSLHSYHSDLDELDLAGSSHEVRINPDTEAPINDLEDKQKGSKPWWAKVKPIKQMQNMHNRAETAIQDMQTRAEFRVSRISRKGRSNIDQYLPDLCEDDLEQSRGEELTDRDSRQSFETCSSENEMPCDLDHPSMHAPLSYSDPPSPTEQLHCEADYFNSSMLGIGRDDSD